jgi:hypothetical protein
MKIDSYPERRDGLAFFRTNDAFLAPLGRIDAVPARRK